MSATLIGIGILIALNLVGFGWWTWHCRNRPVDQLEELKSRRRSCFMSERQE